MGGAGGSADPSPHEQAAVRITHCKQIKENRVGTLVKFTLVNT